MKIGFRQLVHRAGCIRKKYKLTPEEAAYCTLWLTGAREQALDKLAGGLVKLRNEERRRGK